MNRYSDPFLTRGIRVQNASNHETINIEWFNPRVVTPEETRIVLAHHVDHLDGQEYGYFFGILKGNCLINCDDEAPYHVPLNNIAKWCYSPFH